LEVGLFPTHTKVRFRALVSQATSPRGLYPDVFLQSSCRLQRMIGGTRDYGEK